MSLFTGGGNSRNLAFYEIYAINAASANRDDLLFGALPGIRNVWLKQQFDEQDAKSNFVILAFLAHKDGSNFSAFQFITN